PRLPTLEDGKVQERAEPLGGRRRRRRPELAAGQLEDYPKERIDLPADLVREPLQAWNVDPDARELQVRQNVDQRFLDFRVKAEQLRVRPQIFPERLAQPAGALHQRAGGRGSLVDGDLGQRRGLFPLSAALATLCQG